MTGTKKKTTTSKAKPSKAKKTTKTPNMAEKLHKAAMKVLDEKKAEGIISVDLKGQSALADYIIIASGGSSRQVAALSEYLRKAFSKLGVKGVRTEGLPQGDWVLIDAGDILVHLFRPEVREFYQLEDRFEETEKK